MAKTTIHSDYIPDNAITSTKIAENSIGAREIATNAITTLYVADGSVTTVKIADDAITSAKLGSALTLSGNTTFSGDMIKDSGNLTLDVPGILNLDADNGGNINFKDGGTHYATHQNENGDYRIISNVQDKDIIFRGNDGGSYIDAMTIDMSTGGNIGLGTSSPNSYSGYTTLTFNNATYGGAIEFENDGTRVGTIFSDQTSTILKTVANVPLLFGANDAEKMRIDSSGNVGIGTNSPSDKLEIGTTTTGGNLRLVSSSYAGNGIARFFGTDGNEKLQIGSLSATSAYIYTPASTDLVIYTGGSEKMRIDSSGRVGIGTNSPATWAGDLLQTGTQSLFGQLDTNEAAYIVNNIAYDGSNWKYITTGTASIYAQDHSDSNAHIWYTVPSGTAGTNASLNERMRIDSSGFVHVGGTDSAHKGLSVKYHTANDSYTPSSFNDYSLLRLNVANAEGNYAGITYTHAGGTEFFTGLVRVGATSDITDYIFQGYNGNSNAYQEYMRINSTGQILANSLGVTTPTFAFSNDTNTGMTRPTGDTLQLITAGAQRLRINANGRIGIGTDGGNSGLHVANGDIRCTAAAIANDANSISISQESAGGVITARGPSTATRGKIYLSVNKSNGGDSLAGFLLDNTGKIGMGDPTYTNQSSPNYQVHICGDGTSLCIESGTGESYIGSQNTSYFHFLGNRNFYFGNRCEASGGFHTYSDERLKENITPISDALDKVAQMNGVTFSWIDAENRGGGDTGKQFGVTAQNMLEVDLELPTLNKDPLALQDEIDNEESTNYYSMDYNRITPFLIEAVKELKTKLEAAEARITELEG